MKTIKIENNTDKREVLKEWGITNLEDQKAILDFIEGLNQN